MPPSHPSLVPSRSTPPPPVGGAAGQSNVAEDTNDDAHAMRLSCSHLWAAARPARGGAGGEGCRTRFGRQVGNLAGAHGRQLVFPNILLESKLPPKSAHGRQLGFFNDSTSRWSPDSNLGKSLACATFREQTPVLTTGSRLSDIGVIVLSSTVNILWVQISCLCTRKYSFWYECK